MVSGANSFRAIRNTTDTITLISAGRAGVNQGQLFQLFDDDDFNNDDGTNVDGDTGEDIPMLQHTYLEDSDDPALNRFAPAYIRPKYDIGDNNDATIFAPNVAMDDNRSLRDLFDFDQVATEASQDFWTVCVLRGK